MLMALANPPGTLGHYAGGSCRCSRLHTARPLTFSIGTGNTGPYSYPRLLEELAAANAAGLVMKGQLMPRGIGMILGFELTLNPFYTTATFVRLAGLPLAERLTELRRPEIRAAILSEPVDPDPALVLGRAVRDFEHMFLLGDDRLEPERARSLTLVKLPTHKRKRVDYYLRKELLNPRLRSISRINYRHIKRIFHFILSASVLTKRRVG
jgi:hypothetical protein